MYINWVITCHTDDRYRRGMLPIDTGELYVCSDRPHSPIRYNTTDHTGAADSGDTVTDDHSGQDDPIGQADHTGQGGFAADDSPIVTDDAQYQVRCVVYDGHTTWTR